MNITFAISLRLTWHLFTLKSMSVTSGCWGYGTLQRSLSYFQHVWRYSAHLRGVNWWCFPGLAGTSWRKWCLRYDYTRVNSLDSNDAPAIRLTMFIQGTFAQIRLYVILIRRQRWAVMARRFRTRTEVWREHTTRRTSNKWLGWCYYKCTAISALVRWQLVEWKDFTI